MSGLPSWPGDAPPPGLSERWSVRDVQSALQEGRLPDVLDALAGMSPRSRAELFLLLRLKEQTAILGSASPELAASILADCDSASLAALFTRFDVATIAPAIRLMPPDDLADLLLHLPREKARGVEHLLDPSLRDEVGRLLQFDPDTAGGLMTTRYLSVPDAVRVNKAVELLRQKRAEESASYVYVVDIHGKLVGTLPLRSLLLANATEPVRSLVRGEIVRLRTFDSKEEILQTFNRHHFVSLPVVDDRDRLVGIVTFDEVLASMRRAEGRVVHGMTGADPREVLTATLTGVGGRIPWVTFTILGGLGCAGVAALFQEALREFVALGLFLPLVLALGESVATQTISVILSALVSGEVASRRAVAFALKEISIGLLIGVFAAAVMAPTSLLWHGDLRLSALLGGATLLSVSWAALLGVAIPAFLVRVRADPSLAAGPIVLALTDLSTLCVYLGGATWWLVS
ncbi:MAG: magnesium transporter [Planctomycetes bacterium]|nr:magnesium transporter [Planctomycetota bacterium]